MSDSLTAPPERPVRPAAQDRRVQRRVAAVQASVGLLFLVLLAVVLVPWGSAEGGSAVRPEDLFTPTQIEAAESYSRAARAWSWSSLAVSLLVAAVLGFTRLGSWCVNRLPGSWWVQVILVVVAWVGVQALATVGFRIGAWRLRSDVGLSTQDWDGFLQDAALSWALEAAALSILVLAMVGLARRFVRTWTLVAGGVLAATVVFVSYVYPTVVEPLFHDFTALPQGALRDQIMGVAAEEGVNITDVMVADASRRTTTLNAWVSGFGDTRRVVLYDTLVEDATPEEVVAVVAHELAHARHDDVLVGTVLGAVGAFAAVGALAVVVEGSRVAPGRPHAVPLVLACVVWGSQLVAPVQSAVSRAMETRADAGALCLTGDMEAFETIQMRLALRSLGDPTPPTWSQRWWGSHPTVLQRVSLARSWDEEAAVGGAVSRSCPSPTP